ncbi:hypothetical protein DVH24_010596 [Malus domestica]|uniref:Reverse transcriptase zinc-binding domain-containing protein n=1 Tax=Malus domestica TaxID=3750 RepID=A0A498JYN0_MALDO|nr:hypothetical protein DVH24_010596 [Malus domestica]
MMGDPLGSFRVSSHKQNREGLVGAQSRQYRATNNVWTPSSFGIYSAASAWDKFRKSKPTVGWSKLVWYNQNIPKMSFILWLVIKCKLSTMDRILTFASSVPVTCVLCSSATESHCHLFFECPFTDGIWPSVLFKCGVPWLRLPWPLFVMWATSCCRGKSLSSIVLKLSLDVTVYYVWREWNNRRFKNSSQPISTHLSPPLDFD